MFPEHVTVLRNLLTAESNTVLLGWLRNSPCAGEDIPWFSKAKAQSWETGVKVGGSSAIATNLEITRCFPDPLSHIGNSPGDLKVFTNPSLSSGHSPGLTPRKTKRAVGAQHKGTVIKHIWLRWLVRGLGLLWNCRLWMCRGQCLSSCKAQHF